MADGASGGDDAGWLVSGPGLAAIVHACERLAAGDEDLTVASALRLEVPAGRAPAVLSAAHARRAAAHQGYPDADRLVLTRDALEQASRPQVAAWRAGRFDPGVAVTDLCCGAGLDTAALARAVGDVDAVDLDPDRVVLARHNTAHLPVQEIRCGDALADDAVAPGRQIHADPSRRSGGRRARRLADYRPPVGALVAAALVRGVGGGIAVSPAIAWDDPDLSGDVEVEFVQVGPDLVEATLWLGDLRRAAASATLLPSGERLTRDGPAPHVEVAEVGAWLVAFVPAAVRARVHDELARRIGATRIDPRRALVTARDDPGEGPWWRRWQVEAVLPARPRAVRTWLRTANPLPLEVQVHGLDADPDRWWREVGRPARGPVGRTLHLVGTGDGATCIVGRDPLGPT